MILHMLLHFLSIFFDWYSGTILILLSVAVITVLLKMDDEMIQHYFVSVSIYTIIFISWRLIG